MVNIMSDVRRLTPEESNPYANLMKGAMENYTRNTQAEYLKKQLEADIFHKRVSPLAQLAASPAFMMMSENARQQIANYIEQGMQNQTGEQSNSSSPFAAISNGIAHMFGRGQNTTEQNNQSSNESPVQGDVRNIKKGLYESTVKPATQNPYDPGRVHTTNEGEEVVQPTGGITEQAQNTITTVKDLKPLIKALSEKSAPLLQPGAGTKLIQSQITGEAKHYGLDKIPGVGKLIDKLASDTKLAQIHQDVTQIQAKAKTALKRLGMSEKDAEDMIEFKKYDNPKSYPARLAKRMVEFENQVKNAKRNIRQIPLNNENEAPTQKKEPSQEVQRKGGTMIQIIAPNGKVKFVPIDQINAALAAGGKYAD